ncbi:MAG: hypothetical protein AAGC81_06960 [Pseudomonadota bacterium]
METLNVLLEAESSFFDALEAGATKTLSEPERVKHLRQDEPRHFARFFFMLKASQINDSTSVARLVDNHNEAVRETMKGEGPGSMRSKDVKNAQFNIRRKAKLQAFFDAAGEPAFDQNDLVDFHFAQMKRSKGYEQIDWMLDVGLLERREVEFCPALEAEDEPDLRDVASSQSLIVAGTDAAGRQTLIEAYAKFLFDIRSGIAEQIGIDTPPEIDNSDVQEDQK